MMLKIQYEHYVHCKIIIIMLPRKELCISWIFPEPKLKVGVEWVTKGQTVSQASSSVAGIARSYFLTIFNSMIKTDPQVFV